MAQEVSMTEKTQLVNIAEEIQPMSMEEKLDGVQEDKAKEELNKQLERAKELIERIINQNVDYNKIEKRQQEAISKDKPYIRTKQEQRQDIEKFADIVISKDFAENIPDLINDSAEKFPFDVVKKLSKKQSNI